jgi:hypothetical protein
VTEVTQDVEAALRLDWDFPKTPYPPKVVTLVSGEKMVVREASRDEVPLLLDALRPLLTVSKDYYDVVASRMYAELLSWYRYRARNEFCLVGVVDGTLAGVVNNRHISQKEVWSHHTMALKRGGRVGAHLFAAKHEYSFEYLGAEKIYIVAESPIGFRRWMEEWKLQKTDGIQHELHGATAWVITRSAYFNDIKPRLVFGERPVPEKLYEQSMQLKIPKADVVKEN